VAAQLPMILGVCGCGLAIWAWRDRRTLQSANASLDMQRQAAETKQRQLADENQRLTLRAGEAGEQLARIRLVNENLEDRLYDADRKIAQLQTELKLALARNEFDEIDQRRKPVKIDASLEMEEAEMPIDPAERLRLKEEAAILQAHLAAVRRARQHATSAVQPKTVLNGEEDKTFWQVWAWTKAKGLRLNPQVSMGEFLETPDSARWSGVFGAFNPRRVDMLISDKNWNPLIVIEHQGSGHRQGNWRLRDAIKGEVLEIATMPRVETVEKEPDESIHGKLDDAFAKAGALPRQSRGRKRRAAS
jgi:hypothetical protein